VRFDFLVAENLAHRALDQAGKALVPRRRAVLARMACQQPRRPQLMRITVLPGLVARQGYQPGLGLRRDHRLLARPRAVVECRQRTIGQCPLDAALDRLMMGSHSSRRCIKRWGLSISQKHSRPLHPARGLRARARYSCQLRNVMIAHRQLDHLPPSCHDATPRDLNY